MASNTPEGFEDKGLIYELRYMQFTDDEYLIDELPHTAHLELDTEDQNFEQGEI